MNYTKILKEIKEKYPKVFRKMVFYSAIYLETLYEKFPDESEKIEKDFIEEEIKNLLDENYNNYCDFEWFDNFFIQNGIYILFYIKPTITKILWNVDLKYNIKENINDYNVCGGECIYDINDKEIAKEKGILRASRIFEELMTDNIRNW